MNVAISEDVTKQIFNSGYSYTRITRFSIGMVVVITLLVTKMMHSMLHFFFFFFFFVGWGGGGGSIVFNPAILNKRQNFLKVVVHVIMIDQCNQTAR